MLALECVLPAKAASRFVFALGLTLIHPALNKPNIHGDPPRASQGRA